MTTDSPGQEVSPVPPSADEDDEGDQDLLELGRFIIVKYDEKRYVSQISDIQGEDIQGPAAMAGGKPQTEEHGRGLVHVGESHLTLGQI
ncbi:unnamed protein product [Pleuronectes platessa]|uniref:Uncharacterized protein n=1 Tax=Pleuronectes platessa TaxID=8262 RepID=A0A9N7ZD68_PLEPL|nr:unnamed protein product [Pleuronectes platessa]